jgi:hypothetical protein
LWENAEEKATGKKQVKKAEGAEIVKAKIPVGLIKIVSLDDEKAVGVSVKGKISSDKQFVLVKAKTMEYCQSEKATDDVPKQEE